MGFTDTFIRRPLLAWVLNGLIVLFGIIAFTYLDLRPYPEVEASQITITTAYPGAAADVVQGFVTGPLQRAVIGAEGIDYYTSSTREALSTINIHVSRGHDTEQVMTEVIAKIASVRAELPPNALEPVVTKMAGGTLPLWVRLRNPEMTPEQITEFYYRVIRPTLSTMEGAAGLFVIGERPFAMRLWLDPTRMAAVGVTAIDLNNAVRANNYISEAGEIRDALVVQPIRAETDINTVREFSNIVIKEDEGAVVRLRDVAAVELTSEPLRKKGFVNGEPGLLVGVHMAPESNPLALSRSVHAALDALAVQLPPEMTMEVFYDIGKFVSQSLAEVTRALFEALAIVALITLLFFGNPRSVMIMLISIPLSLIGTFLIMWMLGYSLNLFTLLALVIAIGLVVDDTIVVVENIHRHIEQGQSPVQAAISGAREVVAPVIAMSLTLVAVFLPVGFMEGLSGKLIGEFVFTLAGSVVISGVVALTLSPMLCSRILKPEADHSIAHWLDERFDRLRHRYASALAGAMRFRPVWLFAAVVVIGVIPALFALSEQELVPTEDPGYLHVAFSAPAHMNEDYISRHGEMVEALFREVPEVTGSLRMEGWMEDGTTILAFELKPWKERDTTVVELQRRLQDKVSRIPGVHANTFIMDLSPAAGSGNFPIEMAIKTTDDYRHLLEVSERFLSTLQNSGKFMFAMSDLNYSTPQVVLEIDRDKAGELGVSMADVAETLSAMLGEGYISRFSYEGESYKVIPQANMEQRLDRSWLERYYVRTARGEHIPLGALVETNLTSKLGARKQFDGLNAATFAMMMYPDVSMQEALDYLHQAAGEVLPPDYSVDFAGKSRAFLQEGNALLAAFTLALLTIYLFLVAQFESLLDPLVVLITVPMSICGAMLFIATDIATLSLFSQVGLITLIGLISKHGILMVDFARRLQEAGMPFQEAIVEAASVRLRPILMTTAAIVMAVIPMLLASGPGAVSRNHIGIVIAAGMTIGTLFTLFVLPVMYTYISRQRQPAGD